MSDIAIKVENLSKLYRIGSRQNGYKTLRESIVTAASSPFRRLSAIFSRPSSFGISSSAVDGRPSAVDSEDSSVSGQRSAVGSDESSVRGRPSTVGSPKSAVDGQRSAVGFDQSAVVGLRSAVGSPKSPVDGPRSSDGSPEPAVSGRPSAVVSSDATVGGQRSAVDSETLWALKNISFEVRRGEVVGIIGRNGAGKSTLLKILSRITEPTEGYAEIRGRVGSLLEVGTGFHAELSGRENIYLSGAILGMRKAEIERKFDEIGAFAEIEKFLDTPVKHYSSGMYVRLAFAVAAHLDPEILLVDEVLAVGDAAFQKKCIGKMKNVANEGRTVLFVSHQMPAVKSLCGRAIQIRSGMVVEDGDSEIVVNNYFSEGGNGLTPERVWDSREKRPGNSQLRLRAIRVLNGSGQIQKTYRSSQPIYIEVEIELSFEHSALCIGFDLIHRNGAVVFRSSHNDRNECEWPKLRKGINRLKCVIPAGILSYGTYSVAPKIGLHAIEWIVNGEAEASFEVQLDHGVSPFWSVDPRSKFPGVIAPCLQWRAINELPPRSGMHETPALSKEKHQ